MNSSSQPAASVEIALQHAQRLLAKNPLLAEQQAREILAAAPGHPLGRLILGASLRRQGQTDSALLVLEPLAQEQASAFPAHLEVGMARTQAGRTAEAVQSFRRAVELQPNSADGWRLLADLYDTLGEAAQADAARAKYLRCATSDPRLQDAAFALVANELPQADARLRKHLDAFPNDIAALRMLAEVAARLRLYPEAERLLYRCLELAPSFDGARQTLAMVLNRAGKPALALQHVDRLLSQDATNPAYLNLRAAVLANLGDYAGSIATYERVLRSHPRQPKIWMSYGHSLRTSGRYTECVTAYRKALSHQPTLGEAYWSLANLKTFRFENGDVDRLYVLRADTRLSDEDRLHIEFALGKALEDRQRFSEAFEHYSAGNALRKNLHPYDAQVVTEHTRRVKELFTSEFLSSRRSMGVSAVDPIFIVGLPRAGSTLIEQVLSSHSRVEGTIELPDIIQIVAELSGRRKADSETTLFESMEELSPQQIRELGERYLATTRVHRKFDRPHFIDKMPNNFLYVGLIHLILPSAKIIDARRHPLACCFSAYKQHFARGQNFSYSLHDLGRYYRDYVSQMAHFDRVLPGRIHRLYYEAMVDDTENQVRMLLNHCGLAFEESCLRFYENNRPIRTASSEQVRQPIFRHGVDQWKKFEPWLGPLKEELGNVLDCYPDVPA
jgi:tetratricopeptide (TPR) repeat protein